MTWKDAQGNEHEDSCDGSLRSFYDLTRVHEDAVNRPVALAVTAAHDAGIEIVYCSGREDISRELTQEWLDKNIGIPGPLFMRAADDKRKDFIVKKELFDNHIRNNYHILWAYDDRNQVVDMYRALGIAVFQVAPGNF